MQNVFHIKTHKYTVYMTEGKITHQMSLLQPYFSIALFSHVTDKEGAMEVAVPSLLKGASASVIKGRHLSPEVF